jgi:hypothetical protein
MTPFRKEKMARNARKKKDDGSRGPVLRNDTFGIGCAKEIRKLAIPTGGRAQRKKF